ncbi:MAG: aromatic amino acid transaminase [Parachlamydiales bacterium]|jgi:aspartate/tyrosine/aromatic aminotransferase
MDIYHQLEVKSEDPILGIPALFRADTHAQKVNLGIGSYQNEEGKPFVFKSVRAAESQIFDSQMDKGYLPILGDKVFIEEVSKVILGEDAPCLTEKRFIAAQSIGGSGAIRIAAEMLFFCGIKKIFIPTPSWPNHHTLVCHEGIQTELCPYYDNKTRQIDFDKLCDSISHMPARSALLLQSSCHNPTGIDLSNDQWTSLCALLKGKDIVPIIDMAYQGMGDSLSEDAFGLRLFAKELTPLFCISFSKNFGLYGERTGLFGLVLPDTESTKKVESNLKVIVRASYSNPPLYGARIIRTILQSPTLKLMWEQELTEIRHRLRVLRKAIVDELKQQNPHTDYSFFLGGKGFFSLTGLSKEQVLSLREESGVYIPENGRINIAGLNQSNIPLVAKAITLATR